MTPYELLSPAIPAPWRGRWWSAYFSASPLAGALYQVIRYRGRLSGTDAEGSMIVASRSAGVRDHLGERLFEDTPRIEELEPVRVWNLRRRLLELGRENDLVFSLAGRFLAPHLFGPQFLLMPAWVGHRTQIPQDPLEQRKMLARVDGDLDLVRRHQLQATLDRQPASVDIFYRDYYRPSMRARYGNEAVLISLPVMRQHLQNGALIWIDSPEGRIGGGLVQREGSTLIFRALGVRHGDPRWSRRGAIAACYCHCFHTAREMGCATLDFGGSRPSLTDGVLRYKRKWGSSLYDSPELSYEDLALHWSHRSPALHTFLARYAPIFRQGNALRAASIGSQRCPGGLAGFLPIDSAELPAGPQELFSLARSDARKRPVENNR